MGLIVQKYGGTSVANAERFKAVARRVERYYRQGHRLVVVVSARGDATDELVALAYEITARPPERELDMLLATGEQQSIALLAMAIGALELPVVSLTGPQVGIVTDRVHTKAKIMQIETTRLRRELEAGRIVIVAGFQGKTEDEEITTLGRGGSDTTAVALAAALGADACEIYTDVDGVYTADPRVVPAARKLERISYDEMLEMASLGAQVLQPRAVELARQHGVRLSVLSSFQDVPGTLVEEGKGVENGRSVTGVACDFNVAKIGVFGVPDRPGVAYRIFSTLAEGSINVDMIVQSTTRQEVNDISFTISATDLPQAVPIMERVSREIGASGFAYEPGVAKVSIVGAGMITNPGVAAQMFQALAKANINIEMISTSEIKISCIVRESRAKEAAQALHEKFCLGDMPTIAASDEAVPAY